MVSARRRAGGETVRARLTELRGREREETFRYSLPDPWKRKLFVALCRRYSLTPYREPGRRYSTVLVRVPRTFHERTLWPECLALSEELDAHLQALTDRLIREAINEDVSEATEQAPKALGGPAGSGGMDQPTSTAGSENAGSDERSPT